MEEMEKMGDLLHKMLMVDRVVLGLLGEPVELGDIILMGGEVLGVVEVVIQKLCKIHF